MNDLKVTRIDVEMLMARAAELAAIHQAAFNEPDSAAARYRDVEIPEMVTYPGLACVVAGTNDHLVGFAIGHDAAARPQWLRSVMTAVRGTLVPQWLPEAWYLADIAVLPELQGHGVGQRMHAAIMDLTSDRQRMLITYHGDHPAKRFYRRLGWIEIVPDLEYLPGALLSSLMMYAGRKP